MELEESVIMAGLTELQHTLTHWGEGVRHVSRVLV